MAMINTLRNKMGKFVVALIAIAILSFVLNDLLGSNSIMTGQDNSVGEINGNDITFEQYQNIVDYQEQNFSLYSNRRPTKEDDFTINERAWQWLIGQYAFKEQYKEVGIEVSTDELWDMQQGENIDPTVKAFFANPETNEFDRQAFNQFIKNKNTRSPQAQYIWNIIYPSLRPGRERVKYENLMIKTSFVTEAEGMLEHQTQSNSAEVKYLYVPFYSVSDSAVSDKVTDAMLKEYYNKNKEEYKVEEQRKLIYVSFDIKASATDSSDIRKDMVDLATEFSAVSDDSLFAAANSDAEVAFGRYHRGDLPSYLGSDVDDLEKGKVYGPFLDGNSYVIAKVSDVYEDTVFYSRARHILFKWDSESDEDKATAREEARGVLSEIKNGADFAAMARQHGTDGTAQRGGDLGWFPEGRMVEEFGDAVFNARSTGLISNLVETSFGYHIIEVTEEKTNKRAAVAQIERLITPSNNTINEAYRKADIFKSKVNDVESFRDVVAEDSLRMLMSTDLGALDRFVTGLGNARALVQWLFRDASIGKVSDVYEINDKYVVAVMTTLVEEGYLSFEKARARVLPKVKNELKADIILNKLKSLEGSLEEIQTSYGSGANLYTEENLNLSVNSLPSVGFAPYAVGKVFSLENGERSEAFVSRDNGVLIVEMINKTEAGEIADYTTYKNSIQSAITNTASQNIEAVIKEEANIVDKRYRVY